MPGPLPNKALQRTAVRAGERHEVSRDGLVSALPGRVASAHMANITFGERMRRGRIQNAWSQAELAEKLGVAQATVSNWEVVKTVPDKEQKERIKEVLGLG